MKRDFNRWLDNFIESIADFKYYTDFPKVYENVERVKKELYLLNTLIISKDIKKDFKSLVDDHPNVLKAIPILLAKRENEIRVIDKGKNICFNFNKTNHTSDKYVNFMEQTGLFDMLSNHGISNLLDYAIGVEVGLDSNARKNRTGVAMENIVESFIIEAGYIKNVNYFRQMSTKEIREKFGIKLKLSSIKESKADKRFDFVIKAPKTVYAIEVNFYSGGGSKLNETARSYKMLSQETSNIDGFKFVWITDGKAWISARRNLEETFDVLADMYNIKDLENGIIGKLI